TKNADTEIQKKIGIKTRKGIIEAASLYWLPRRITIISFPAMLSIATRNIINATIMDIYLKKSLSSGLFSNFSYATGVQNVENVWRNTITNATNLIAAVYRPNSSKSDHCRIAILSNDSNSHVIKMVNTNGAPNLMISDCE